MAAKARALSTVAAHDDYLATLSDDKRAALQKLRTVIKAAAPKAQECISYQLAAFRLDGRMLVAIGAAANHCAFYLMSDTTVAAHADELAKYDTSKGTIRFRADKPLPVALVRKLVKARIAENAVQSQAKKSAARTGKRAAKGEPASVRAAAKRSGGERTDSAVDAFIRALDHPLKQELETLRQLILGVGSEISEGIKWNSPSFRTTEWFATINVHGENTLRFILHTGAKVKAGATAGLKIADPAGLLKWLAKDRALVTFSSGKDFAAKSAAMRAIIREWVRQL